MQPDNTIPPDPNDDAAQPAPFPASGEIDLTEDLPHQLPPVPANPLEPTQTPVPQLTQDAPVLDPSTIEVAPAVNPPEATPTDSIPAQPAAAAPPVVIDSAPVTTKNPNITSAAEMPVAPINPPPLPNMANIPDNPPPMPAPNDSFNPQPLVFDEPDAVGIADPNLPPLTMENNMPPLPNQPTPPPLSGQADMPPLPPLPTEPNLANLGTPPVDIPPPVNQPLAPPLPAAGPGLFDPSAPVSTPPESPGPLIPQRIEPEYTELPDNFVAPDLGYDQAESSGPSRWLFIAGGALVALLLIGGGVLFALSRANSGSNEVVDVTRYDQAVEQIASMDQTLKGGLSQGIASITNGPLESGTITQSVESMQSYLESVEQQHQALVELEALGEDGANDELEAYRKSYEAYSDYAAGFITAFQRSAGSISRCYETIDKVSDIQDGEALKAELDTCATDLTNFSTLSSADFEILRARMLELIPALKTYVDAIVAADGNIDGITAASEVLAPSLSNYNTALSNIDPVKSELQDLQSAVINLDAAVRDLRSAALQP